MFVIPFKKNNLNNKNNKLIIPGNSDIFEYISGLTKEDIFDKYLIFQPGCKTYGHIFKYDNEKEVLTVEILNSLKDIPTVFKKFAVLKNEEEHKIWKNYYEEIISPSEKWSISRNSLVLNIQESGNLPSNDLLLGNIKDEDIEPITVDIELKRKNIVDFFTEKTFKSLMKSINKKITQLISEKENSKNIYRALVIRIKTIEIDKKYEDNKKLLNKIHLYFENILMKFFNMILSYYLNESKLWFKTIRTIYENKNNKNANNILNVGIVSLYDEKGLAEINFSETPYIVYYLKDPTMIMLSPSKIHAGLTMGILKYNKGIFQDTFNMYQPLLPVRTSLYQDYYFIYSLYDKIEFDKETAMIKLYDIEDELIKLSNEIYEKIKKQFNLKSDPKTKINNMMIMHKFNN